VVHPQSPHGVMDCGINPHRRFVGVLSGDLLVDIEKISVTLANRVLAQTRDGIGKIKINTAATRADTTALVAHFLGGAGSDVARSQISEARIFSLEVIIAIRVGDLIW